MAQVKKYVLPRDNNKIKSVLRLIAIWTVFFFGVSLLPILISSVTSLILEEVTDFKSAMFANGEICLISTTISADTLSLFFLMKSRPEIRFAEVLCPALSFWLILFTLVLYLVVKNLDQNTVPPQLIVVASVIIFFSAAFLNIVHKSFIEIFEWN